MKRVIYWILEEKITLMILLLAIGIILSTMHSLAMLGGMVVYSVIILAVLNAGHKLLLKYKKK
ncbi:hypothetical protein JW930_03275 [Candidatus Woesearchaeota archaeon]|nr:hypothetical protein [Candidatus Woesearchaeota archaeon]